MEHHICNIRTFTTENFTVSVDAYEDYDVDLSWDDTGEVRRKLEDGTFTHFRVECTITHTLTGAELASHLGGCIYEDPAEFQDHRACGVQNRRRARNQGRWQIYRQARAHKSCLSTSDKLKKRGFATRERAESWAKVHAKEPWEVFNSAGCGSYFKDMIRTACVEARKQVRTLSSIKLRR